jgi:hypothetical protein
MDEVQKLGDLFFIFFFFVYISSVSPVEFTKIQVNELAARRFVTYNNMT